MLGWLTASLNAGYDNVNYVLLTSGISNNRSDNYYPIRANLQDHVNRHLATTLFFVHLQDASSIGRYLYVDNMVGARVNWNY